MSTWKSYKLLGKDVIKEVTPKNRYQKILQKESELMYPKWISKVRKAENLKTAEERPKQVKNWRH